LEFEDVGFEEGEKPKTLEKNSQSKARTNNKHNPHTAV